MSVAEPGSDREKGPPVVGSYRLIQPLGTGGMSSVFRALHIDTGHDVAIKILPRSLAKNPTLLQRFLREARNAESLQHPNIAAIYDRGYDQGRHYLILEYVEGGDLHDRVRNGGPMTPAEAVRAIRDVAEGLRYAAGLGVIHRDVKPANLLLTPSGRVKIIDLGLALQTEGEDERVTRDGTTVGTVDYMSPEQARDSRATSERSDIYSLGCTFYFLLVGTAPYPGGDVPDKLGRHCTAPIPDVRMARPETSEPLARLVRRMMAKKPDARFGSYDDLIAALDALPEAGGTPASATAGLDALIDDDEDDNLLALPMPSSSAQSGPRPGRAVTHIASAAPAEISLADLAGIEDDEDARPARRRQSSPALAAGPDWSSDGLEPDLAEPTAGFRPSSREVPLSTWIAAGAALGLAIALLGYGVLQVLGPPGPAAVASGGGSGVEGEGSPEPDVPPAESAPRLRPAPKPVPPRVVKPIITLGPTPTPAWSEPADPVAVEPAEPPYPAEVEAAMLPESARRPIPVAQGPSVTLLRVNNPADASEVATLRLGLDRGVPIVEIADDGPFFEDDVRLVAKSQTIRGRPGFRPIVKLQTSTATAVRDRPGVFVIDGTRLTIEGVDLVVDVADLAASKSSLFLLKGGDLILDRCTLTVVNAGNRPFSLVRVEETGTIPPRPSTVRIERSLVRGPMNIAIDARGPAELALLRSVVLGPTDAAFSLRAGAGRGDRRIGIVRSVVATRGGLLDFSAGGTTPYQVRALGSTFAKVEGVDGRGLILVQGDGTPPLASILDWDGRDNAYLGWPAWGQASDRRKTLLAGLASAREVWKGTEAGSRESRSGWPARIVDEEVTASRLVGLSEDRPAVLSGAAVPAPSLLGETVGSIRPLPMPEMPPRPALRGPGGAVGIGGRARTLPKFNITNAPPTPPPLTTGAAPNPGELAFDLADPAWRGDLGRFLAGRVTPGTGHVRVRVTGGGTWTMTPVRLPDGASVEVESAAPAGAGPTWTPISSSSAPALIELNGGDLRLTGLAFASSSLARVGRLIRVEDGHLALSGCVLKSSEASTAAGTGLILFRAAGTKPLPGRFGPFLSTTDRPTCVLADCILSSQGGEAIGAEIGRGQVVLINTAVMVESDGAAIALRPQNVARSRFEADLVLDRCSIAAARDLVRIGAWPGTAPGPGRPWLVVSTRTAFLEIAPRGKHEAVVLRSIDDGLARGALFWQGTGDGFDINHFTAAGAQAPAQPGLGRPDVKAQWVDFWGARHASGAVGPSRRRAEPGLSLVAREKLRPGVVVVESLRLDPKAHPDLGVDFRLLPLSNQGGPVPRF